MVGLIDAVTSLDGEATRLYNESFTHSLNRQSCKRKDKIAVKPLMNKASRLLRLYGKSISQHIADSQCYSAEVFKTISSYGAEPVIPQSTGNLWINFFESVKGNGVRAVLANPLKMKAIASAKIRNDKVDARVLAFFCVVVLWLSVMFCQKMLGSLGLSLGIRCSLFVPPPLLRIVFTKQGSKLLRWVMLNALGLLWCMILGLASFMGMLGVGVVDRRLLGGT